MKLLIFYNLQQNFSPFQENIYFLSQNICTNNALGFTFNLPLLLVQIIIYSHLQYIYYSTLSTQKQQHEWVFSKTAFI